MSFNKFLCSDLRGIHAISKELPKGVMVITDGACLEMTENIFERFEYYLGKNHPPIVAGFQLICCLHPPHFSFNYNTTVGVVVYLLLSQSFYLVIILLSCPGRCFHFYSIISVVLDSGR